MSEAEKNIDKKENEVEQGLIPTNQGENENLDDEYLGDLKMQAQEYGQKIQEVADKAKDFANETFIQVGDKLNEIKDKNPKEIVEEAKEYAGKNPGQTILVSAAVGLVVGLIFRSGRK